MRNLYKQYCSILLLSFFLFNCSAQLNQSAQSLSNDSQSRSVDSGSISTNGGGLAQRSCLTPIANSDIDALSTYLFQDENADNSTEGPATFCLDFFGDEATLRVETEFSDERGIVGYTLNSQYMFFSQTNPNDFEVHFRDPAGVVKVEGQISITGDIHADLSFANMVKIQDGAAYPTESVQNECRSDVTGQGSYDSSPSNTITTPQSCAQNFVMSPRFWLETPAFQVSPATNNSFLDWPNVQNSQFYQDNNSLMNIVKVSAQYADGVFPNDFNRMGIKHGKIGDLVFPAP